MRTGVKGFVLIALSFFLGLAVLAQKPEEYQIIWERNTLERVSQEGFRYAGYARAEKLQNGDLVFVYEGDGSVFFRTKSGENWSDPVTVAPKKPGINMAVPEIIQLENGKLLVGYNPRPRGRENENRFAIRTVKSEDMGKTWVQDQLVYEGGAEFQNGVWEPVFLELPNGEIQMYFANEAPYRESDEQEISVILSKDGGSTWSENVHQVSFTADFRDGMPVPICLESTGKIAVVIEDNSDGAFKPVVVYSEGKDWNKAVLAESPQRTKVLEKELAEVGHAGAPYLVQMENGLTLISFQMGEDLNHSQMAVALGNENAADFSGISFPFDLDDTSRGLWNSLEVISENEVLALTSTNAFSRNGETEVWMIKGRIHKRR